MNAISRRKALQAGAAATAAASFAGKSARAADTSDVLILGAGLAGLNAALHLEELGAKVRILEGRDRLGGRVFTLKQLPGHPEAGGNTFGSGYGRCLDMCERLKLPLRDFVPRGKFNAPGIYMQGQYSSGPDWAKSSVNIQPDEWKAVPPYALADRLYSKFNPLKAADDWYDPKSFQYDVSAHSFFKSKGFTDAQIDQFFTTNIAYGTSAHDVSVLMMFYQEVWFRGMSEMKPTNEAVIGGNYQLTDGMAKMVKGEILLKKQVQAISADDGGVEVTCADGSSFRAKRLICTLPMPVLRYIRFSPALPELHNKAIKTVPYFPMTQTHLVVKGKFWDDDGRPPAMFTDTVAGYVMANRFDDDPTVVTSLTAWARGYNAVRVDQFDPSDVKKMVVAEIERLRPAAKGKLEAAYVKSWVRDPFAGGDYSIWGPGQVREFVGEIGKPVGRVHFAGEHTAMSNRGMEGAMESGERAAQEAIQSL